jgi:hypothetical protein
MPDEPTDDDSTDDVAETFLQDSGPGRDEMAADYLPGDDDWLAKTHLDVGDPAAIAALRNFAEIYPEVDDLQPLIDGALDELLRGRTSVGGMSREEYRSILENMYGGKSGDEQGTAMQLVAPEDD